MSPSIFKSICATAAFLAAPAAAQIRNWDIVYQSLETDFRDSVANEITLDYLIGKGRTFSIDLFDKGCADPITGMAITPTAARTNGFSDDHDRLEIMLDLDKTAITSSNIWSGIELEFCVRVQLLSNGSVIKEDKREIDVAFDFVIDFEADEDVAMQTAAMTSGSGQANVDSYCSVCKCDDLDSFTCNAAPLAPNSILSVCIQSTDSDVEIAFLSNLELFRGDTLGNETLRIVDGMAVQNSEISVLRSKNATAVGVASVVPSSFFSYSGVSTATVSGVVQVKLVGPRRQLRRVAFDYDASPGAKSGIPARAMRGESVARPGYGGSNNDDSPFEITIGMARQADEHPRVMSIYHNSATTKAPVSTQILGAVVGFAWIFS